MDNNTVKITNHCAFLGTINDVNTCYRFPSRENYCLHCKSLEIPKLDHQAAFCLTQNHKTCKVFIQDSKIAFPRDLKEIGSTSSNWVFKKKYLVILLILIVLGVSIVISLEYNLFPFMKHSVIHSQENTPNELIVPVTGMESTTSTGLLQLDATLTPTKNNTAISSQGTSTKTPPPQLSSSRKLEQPFTIGQYSFILHQVKEGEYYEIIANNYNTSSKLLQKLNQVDATSVLRTGSVIIIVQNATEVEPNFPDFRIIHINEDSVTSADLAETYLFDQNLLKQYNGCNTDCVFKKGDWIILPKLR